MLINEQTHTTVAAEEIAERRSFCPAVRLYYASVQVLFTPIFFCWSIKIASISESASQLLYSGFKVLANRDFCIFVDSFTAFQYIH